MNTPTVYIILNKGELPDDEGDFEVGSNFDWIKKTASTRAEGRQGPQVVYKLVPILEYSLEVTTKVITKDLVLAGEDDRRDWDEADRIEAERSK